MSYCPTCGATTYLRPAMPLLDGTPVLMCQTCGRIDTLATWTTRASSTYQPPTGDPQPQMRSTDE